MHYTGPIVYTSPYGYTRTYRASERARQFYRSPPEETGVSVAARVLFDPCAGCGIGHAARDGAAYFYCVGNYGGCPDYVGVL